MPKVLDEILSEIITCSVQMNIVTIDSHWHLGHLLKAGFLLQGPNGVQ
jgi:hypothetical protein